MEDLKKKLSKLFDNRRKRYGKESVDASADAATEALCERRREVEQDDVVGFRDNSTALVQKLTEGNLQLGVVSIVGTCGLGKTTLARKVYNNVDIKSHFNCRAWVCISQNFKTRDVLLEILKSEMPKSDELTRKKLFKYSNDDELKKKLFKCLQGRRYLIVMDDIITEVWDEVRSSFPDEANGSIILLITSQSSRLKDTSISHSLLFLNEDESWELFIVKVFRGGTCPPELETLGRQIASHCCGLPLSIVVLGSQLANKEKTREAWSELISNLNWDPMASSNLSSDIVEVASTKCKDILALTYTLLPQHLKPCFLYFGVYPEGFEIPVSQLVQMWIAVGFIKHTDRTDPEDVAEEYLEELIDLSLIQVASRRTNGGVKTCRIHALIHKLCILESAKEKFLEVVNLLLANKSLRVCIQGSIDPYISSNLSHPSLSLLFLGQRTYRFDPNHWKWVLENFKLLQVLNFGCVDLYSIPTRIEELVHLRYLGVESDALKAIPDSIGKFINVETLDFRGTFLNCLPKAIWMLPRLKNLYMSGPVSLPDNLDPEVRALSSLQTLSTVSLNPQSDCPIVEAKLPNLRKLGIWFAADESNNKVLDVLKYLHHLDRLQILKIINCSERPCLPISLPLSITKITLRHVRIEVRRDMKVLGKLPNLQILKLQSCLLSSKFYVFAGSFPQLRVLKLENLRIKKWKQRRGATAMPCLEHLVIKGCVELTMLPSNLWSLAALRAVEILWSTSELAKMLREMQKKVEFKLLIYPTKMTNDLPEKTVTESESRVSEYLARRSPPTPPPLPPVGKLRCLPFSRPLYSKERMILPRKHKQKSEIVIGNRFGTQVFSLEVLLQATGNFSVDNKIGTARFGSVYHATLDDGREVAIKRAEISTYAQEEFLYELEALSRLNHKNLVRLLGFCEDSNERVLVYEFMQNGTLHDHLHRLQPSPLMSWAKRIKAALDAARGIEYLHVYAVPPIIHRNIKSSNVLLDASWTAKVSGFGLSQMGPADEDSHLSLPVAGTLGYIDPEYLMRGQLTTKSDVYGFGVLLLEMLSGYKAIHQNETGDTRNVVDFVAPYIVQDQIHRVLDPHVPPSPYEIEAVACVGYVAVDCVNPEGRDRPTMTEIVHSLERALATCLAHPVKDIPENQQQYQIKAPTSLVKNDAEIDFIDSP